MALGLQYRLLLHVLALEMQVMACCCGALLAHASCVSIPTPKIKQACLLLFEPTSQARFIPML